jgi:SNF2 family DNA or RNA helicase
MEEELFALLDNGEKITAPAVLAQRTRLRQICLEPNLLSLDNKVSSPSAKTEIVMELVEDADSPVIVMTFFEQYARILTEELRKAGFKGAEYSGAPDIVPQRHQIVMDFQAGKYQFLVGTITSIGLGLTLTAAHQLIFTDMFFNPQVVNQCVSRLEGSGPPVQTHPVEVVDLWAKGTVEDHLHRVLHRKREMFNAIVATEQEVWQETIDEMRASRSSRR